MQVNTAPVRYAVGEGTGGVEKLKDMSLILVTLERAKQIRSQILELDLSDNRRVRFSTFYMPFGEF